VADVTTPDPQGAPVAELDTVAAELAAARAELRESLMLAGEWARYRADHDPMAAHISERIAAAFDRLTASNSEVFSPVSAVE
jgi:hypothetical protein